MGMTYTPKLLPQLSPGVVVCLEKKPNSNFIFLSFLTIAEFRFLIPPKHLHHSVS